MYVGTCRGGVNSGSCCLEGAAPRRALISRFVQKERPPEVMLGFETGLNCCRSPGTEGVFTDAAVHVKRARNNKA